MREEYTLCLIRPIEQKIPTMLIPAKMHIPTCILSMKEELVVIEMLVCPMNLSIRNVEMAILISIPRFLIMAVRLEAMP